MYRHLSAIIIGGICLVLLVGCGNRGVRSSQDWSKVRDDRLFQTVQVGNWGSGVVLERTKGQFLVLTCAHLVNEGATVPIYLVDQETLRYKKYRAHVIKRSHEHREDLALLSVLNAPDPMTPFRLELADDFKDGETRPVAIMNISLGAQARPFLLEQFVTVQSISLRSNLPDSSGATSWVIPKGCMLGGIREANSGSPIFEGSRLVGLAESSPNILTTVPQVIRTFLNGLDWKSPSLPSEELLVRGTQSYTLSVGKSTISDCIEGFGMPETSQRLGLQLLMVYRIGEERAAYKFIFNEQGIFEKAVPLTQQSAVSPDEVE